MEILFYDHDLAVCVKPVGLDSQIGVPEALKAQLGGEFYPVHRLDENVGGVMVYARTSKAAAMLSREIQVGTFVKEYLAQVHGTPPEQEVWEDLLFKDSRKNKVFVVRRERTGVRKAKLEFTRLTAGETSLVAIRLYTGRSHQIRVQFASRGLPLVGERKYALLEDPCQLALWSAHLGFAHPTTGEPMSFDQEPPMDYPWTAV